MPILAGLDLALYVALESRPGFSGVLLWYLGPPLLGLLAAALLVVALVGALRARVRPDRRRLAGYLGLTALVVSIPMLYRVYPSSRDATPSRVTFRLPLDGPVRVAWGGPSPATNYHVVLPDQRWAYDLLVTREGRSFTGDGQRSEQYYAYGQPVLAPAAGAVRAARDGEPDTPIGRRRPARTIAGNHVVLEVAPDEFLFVAHLQPGSVTVRTGDRVKRGQVLGLVGNSGWSSEPHVHLHLQDTPTLNFGEAIPLYFHDYTSMKRRVDRGLPEGGRTRRRFFGDVVSHALAPRP